MNAFFDECGMVSVGDLVGRAVPKLTDWQHLHIDYAVKAKIDQDLCIKCGRCYAACEDTSHQAITNIVDGKRGFEVIEEECVGCNPCASVCPVEHCIDMAPMAAGTVDPRTGMLVGGSRTWKEHPNNPGAVGAVARERVAAPLSVHAHEYELEATE